MTLFRRRSATEPLDRLPFLAGVDLTDSLVRSWQSDADRLVFRLDASLWPLNPGYEAPKSGEHTCYKPAVLVFYGIFRLSLPSQDQITAAYNAVEGGYDSIDFIGYNNRERLWHISVGTLDFAFGCSGVRFDLAAA